jgi:hypothetical protein
MGIGFIGTRHSYDTIEVPGDCNDIRRDGQKTEKGKDWEDTGLGPETPGNKIVRLLGPSNWHLTHISVHKSVAVEARADTEGIKVSKISRLAEIKARLEEGKAIGFGGMCVVTDPEWLIQKLERAKELLKVYAGDDCGIPLSVTEFLKEVGE